MSRNDHAVTSTGLLINEASGYSYNSNKTPASERLKRRKEADDLFIMQTMFSYLSIFNRFSSQIEDFPQRRHKSSFTLFMRRKSFIPFPFSVGSSSLPRSRFLGCHATLGGALRDSPKKRLLGRLWPFVMLPLRL